MSDLATIPQLANRLAEMGEAVGELDGQQFYAVRVVVATAADGRIEVRGLLDEWRATLEGRLIASEARARYLEDQLAELASAARGTPEAPPPPQLPTPAPRRPIRQQAVQRPCPHCGRDDFAHPGGRGRHIKACKDRERDPAPPAPAPEPAPDAPAPRPIAPCPHCGRAFAHILGRQRHIDACARRQAEAEPAPAEPEPARRAPSGRFGEEAIAPRWEPKPLPRPAEPIERHQCPSCMRSFDSISAYNRHRCEPAPPAPRSPYAEFLPPPPPIRPADPEEAAQELARLSAGNWPRPCPECWAAGHVEMLRGPAGMAAHRKAAHGIVPAPLRPAVAWRPSPDAWACAGCGSGAFAQSAHDPELCVRCVVAARCRATEQLLTVEAAS